MRLKFGLRDQLICCDAEKAVNEIYESPEALTVFMPGPEPHRMTMQLYMVDERDPNVIIFTLIHAADRLNLIYHKSKRTMDASYIGAR